MLFWVVLFQLQNNVMSFKHDSWIPGCSLILLLFCNMFRSKTRHPALEDWRELVLNYAHQVNESCGRQWGPALPLRCNYATAQVHYAFPFSLHRQTHTHRNTHSNFGLCRRTVTSLHRFKVRITKALPCLMAVSRTFWTLHELINCN